MSDSYNKPASRAQRIARNVLLGLLSFVFFVTGAAKVLLADFMMTNMAEINFGTAATVIIGVIEVVAVVLLWLPRYRTLALSVCLLTLAGAAGAHWGFGHPAGKIIPIFAIAGLCFAAIWIDRGAELWRFVLRG